VEESVWDKILDVNVKCTALLVKEALPYLKERRNASIVIVSSIGGFMPFSALGPYSTSKTALLGLTKALATELAPAIRVNCIAPGIIKTKFSSAIWQNDVIAAETIKNIPMGRLGEAEECAGAVSFLCSEDASYITGETIVISGGMPSRL
jgi:dehydrogenase/reductase SDR family protein 4